MNEPGRPPFFSVLIPTYNRAALLGEAIHSVLGQSFEDYELIVVDDHSTDGTRLRVEEVHDARIRYVLNERLKGTAGARNTGIFTSRGKWIAFLDSDDIWLPDKLQSVYEILKETDGDVGLVYTGFTVHDFTSGRDLSIHFAEKEGRIHRDLLYDNYIGTFSTVVINTELARSIGGCDERFQCFEDNDLYVRIAEISRVAAIREPMTYVRQSNGDRLEYQTEKWHAAYKLFLEKHKSYIRKSPRLRHRLASMILLRSIRLKKSEYSFQILFWTLAGVLFDTLNFAKTCWGVILTISGSRNMEKAR